MNIFKLRKENSYRYNNSLLNFYSRVFFFFLCSHQVLSISILYKANHQFPILLYWFIGIKLLEHCPDSKHRLYWYNLSKVISNLQICCDSWKEDQIRVYTNSWQYIQISSKSVKWHLPVTDGTHVKYIYLFRKYENVFEHKSIQIFNLMDTCWFKKKIGKVLWNN